VLNILILKKRLACALTH